MHHRLERAGGLGADGHVDGPGGEQGNELVAVTLDELDVEVLGPTGEQFDEAGGGVLGEKARGRQAHQPPSLARLAHLPDRAVLETEQLAGAAGQSQATGGKGQAVAGAGEQLVLELAA